MSSRNGDLLEPRAVSSTSANSSPRAIRNRVADIDAEMANLQARLVCLAGERKPLVEALKYVVYPVLTLPVELTAEIFLQYFTRADIGGSDPNVPHPLGWIPPCGPLLLASICREWRRIALSLQPIWSNFHIAPTENAISSAEKLLQCWLPRTGNHPLEVDLGRRGLDTLCAALVPRLPQLRVLSCSVESSDTFPSDLFRGRTPLLRTLNITFSKQGNDDVPPFRVTCFEDAPQLRAVFLGHFVLPSITLPWGQLTYLQLYGQTTTECAEILRQTPRLETLVVGYIFDEPVQLAPARLEHLHTLKFEKYQRDLALLAHVTLPALTHLELAMSERHEFGIENPIKALFTAFITRSGCSLRSITIMAPGDLQATTDCLRACPTLSIVHLTDFKWNSYNFLEALRKPDFLPNVRSLSLNPCRRVMEIPYEDLAALLASRRQERGDGTSRLESFELVMAGNPDWEPAPPLSLLERGLEALRALEADGLKVNIRSLQKLTASVDAVAVYPPIAKPF
ncbi:hypothetical protein DFH06DRAFT_142185 [Mycena polygramma]|nr:hypothetical protein DFH06DRAFT_142185 [Mycena polygramma]